MMHEALTWALSGGMGVALGAIFYGGLWWTVRKGVASRWAALWFPGSLLLRMGTVLVGFYFVSGGHWERLVPCLVGFVLARPIVTWLTRPSANNPPRQEAHHAT